MLFELVGKIRRNLAYTPILGLLLIGLATMLNSISVQAASGVNQQLNFQGRLLNIEGDIVADGYYNVEFKIYQDGTGAAVGNPDGILKWTESWLNSNGQGVRVVNGYISVQLGSITSLSSVDWNQDTLWLSMNIGNTAVGCAPFSACAGDGEMLPMKRLSAVPYALNAARLGGYEASQFIRSSTVLQDANLALRSVSPNDVGVLIQGNASQVANILDVRAGDASLALAVTASGSVGIGKTPSSSYALDVGGALNTDNALHIAGVSTLTNSSLTFSGNTTGTIIGAPNQVLSIRGGDASVVNTNGSDLTLQGGNGNGTGAQGLVVISTPTFTTTGNDPNCYPGGNLASASCTIALSSVDNSSAIIVGFDKLNLTATLPDPTILTPGRIIYVTAANNSTELTLSVNGGGPGNLIAMRQNTTATMIWNGHDWTTAGASNSTTLQSAYDNTLQSAGGAELVVSKTTATDGLTIRDSAVNSVNGTLLTVQNSSAAGLLQVNSNVTEYASDSGAEIAGASGATTFPDNTWLPVAGSTVSRHIAAGNYIATGQGSVSIVTGATAGSGVKNVLTSPLTANMNYNVSFTTRLTSGTFTDLAVHYSADGTTESAVCATNKTSATSIWTKINCTFKAPSAGISASNAILIRQSSGVARTFYVDNLSVTIAADYNFATDGNVNDGVNFASNWSSAGVGTVNVTRNTADGHNASDSAKADITTGAANAGLRNRLSANPLPKTLYRVTIYAKSSNAFNDFKVRYSPDNGTSFVECVDYNTQNISTTSWTKVTCYIQTAETVVTAPYIYFVESSGAARSFSVDGFNMSINTTTTPNVQIGSGVNGGPTTLFTLDKGASAPIASDNEAFLGSMYYDTTLGKLQCYEADGWGACGSSPDNIITISPEYNNAVLHGTGIGTMTSDLCSSTLGINDGSNGQPTVCGNGETYNFYKWTSPQASAQTYSIYVTYQLPATFKEFNSGQTSLMARSDSGTSGGAANVAYQVYRNSNTTGLVQCGTSSVVSTGTVANWQVKAASGDADPSTCGFLPGDSIVFKIDVTASRNANAYVGNLNFAFGNR